MWDLARFLDSHGHRVTAVTSRFFYGSDRRHPLPRQRIGRIDIRRLGGTAFGKSTYIGRLADFATFYGAAAAGLAQIGDVDVVLALTSPPMIASLAVLRARLLRWLGGRPLPVVYHIMDLYPDAATASGVLRENALPDRALRCLTRWTAGHADAVIALGQDMKQRLIERPWADSAELHPICRTGNALASSLSLHDTFNVVYSGNLGVAHDVDTMVEAIRRTHPPTRPPARGDLRWIFIGGGARFDRLQATANAQRWTHVRFLPFQDRANLNQSLNLADVHLVSQLPEFTGVVVPSKLFGILAVGKPAIVIAPPQAECARIVHENHCGIVVPNGDADQLVHAVQRLCADPDLRKAMGQRARSAFEKDHHRDIACGQIERLLRLVARQIAR
jgi:glycosyltransferase involved in cell wall biosynthesis